MHLWQGNKQTGQGWFCLTIRNIRKTFRGIHEKNKDNNKRNYTITASKSIRPDQAATVRDKGLKGTQDIRKSVRLEQTHAADRTAARGAVLELIDYSCQGPKGVVVRGIHVCPSRFRICAPARPSASSRLAWKADRQALKSVSNPARDPPQQRSKCCFP